MKILRFTFALFLCIILLCGLIHAQTYPDSTADVVIGQANFTSNGLGTTQTNYNFPAGIAVDTTITPSILYVTDQVNHRILGYYNYPFLQNNAPADFVIGQFDFTTATTSTSDSTLNTPQGIFVDSNGNLWVTDKYNHRILVFLTPAATDLKADYVLGQGGSFTTGTANGGGTASDSVFSQPQTVWLDNMDRLYVSDLVNNRILIFNDPLSNDFKADYVIGQPDFTSSGASTTDSTLNNPISCITAPNGDVYVSDYNNNRILKYINPTGTDIKADQVFGQGGSFITGTANNPALNAQSLYQSIYLAMDNSGSLFIEDSYNHRILVYNTTPFDSTADYVYGQGGSFTTGTSGLTAETLNNSRGIFIDRDGNLIVADHVNHRVLIYKKTNVADIFLTAQNLQFGAVVIGTSDTLQFQIMNSGLDTLLIDSIHVQSTSRWNGRCPWCKSES